MNFTLTLKPRLQKRRLACGRQARPPHSTFEALPRWGAACCAPTKIPLRSGTVEHALLRILRADFDDALAVGDAGCGGAVELDVGLDELNGTVGAGSDRLCGGAGEPIDHGAASDEAKDERRVEQREFFDVHRKAVGERHDDGKNNRSGADYSSADKHGLRSGFERAAGAVVGFEKSLGALEVDVNVVVAL